MENDLNPEMTKLLKMQRDEQENDPILGPKIKAAHDAANKTVEPGSSRRGRCHAVWEEQKRILAEQGINWKSPAELNPHVFFD